MKFNKGDLIVIKTVEDIKTSCIVITVFEGAKYLYVYCIETNSYRLVYEKEVEFIAHAGFHPSFSEDSDFWNIDYSFYEVDYEFPYTPFYSFDDDTDDTEDDE